MNTAAVSVNDETVDTDFETFFTAYLECAVWSSTALDPEDWDKANDGGDVEELPIEEFGLSADDIDDASRAKLREDALAFWDNNEECHSNPSQAGQDFWLTRNGHGAGFWDGDWEHGDELTEASKVYGSVDLWVDKDLKIKV